MSKGITYSFHSITYIFLGLVLLLSGCQTSATDAVTAPTPFRISEAGLAASCPFLTKDQQGRVVLSWVQASDSLGNYLLTYAVSEDGDETFGTPRPIPTTKGVYPHDENLSKILFRQNGDIIAMFAVSNPREQNSYAGLVYYTQSFDKGRTWTEPRQLATNTQESIDERYFDMELLPDGEVAAIWLDSRKEDQAHGSSLYFARTKGREGFVGEKVIDSDLCQCCRTDLYLDEEGRLHVAYRGILNRQIRDMMYMVSADGGNSFSEPERISEDNWLIDGCPHTGPAMAATAGGMHFAWFTMGGGHGVYYARKANDKPFTKREVVSQAPAARHPQMAALSGGNLAIVWDEQAARQTAPNHQVGLQLRNGNGDFLHAKPITPDTLNAVYPVISPLSENRLLVAYTVKGTGATEVWCQVISAEAR
ncbi:exo-alpha-sialidase [Pontibacter qinzhouensis]|uniref:Exo-alpha-sialidase n=1 Tax=Pontibacter qinzhouensis TaxID=2603253 RepID=A0A5C8KA12_9BACT|nr:sialidase family protein [Pontibacter qinzhouensis]TXK48748.1 exo-alpha-sialidase [Pontibacter qinzhouensis]